MNDTITLPRATVQQALEALEDLGMRHFENTGEKLYADIYIALRTALAEPEQSFEDEQRTINADEHRRANALEEAIHAAWSAGYVEGEKAVLEQQAEPVCPDCKAAVLYECVACSSNNYPPQQQDEPISTHRITSWGHCGVCRHDRIPGEGCARQECPDSPQQQAEPNRWVIEKVGDKLLLNGKEIDPGTIEVRLDGLTYRSSEKVEVRQQAEPVAWMVVNDAGEDELWWHNGSGNGKPLYTTLPQRKEDE